jgi:hypothetical protein
MIIDNMNKKINCCEVVVNRGVQLSGETKFSTLDIVYPDSLATPR